MIPPYSNHYNAKPHAGTIARDEPLPPQPPQVFGDPALPLFSKPRIPWGYADAVPKDFDADHFSTGGYKAVLAKEVIRDLAIKYQPDIVLSLLGINDFSAYHLLTMSLDAVR